MKKSAKIEKELIEEVEFVKRLSPGDFMRALQAFWMTLKYFITSEKGYIISIYTLGTFKPGYRSVCRAIKKEIRKIRSGSAKNRERLYFLIRIRRKLIDIGDAPQGYYLRKAMKNGSENDRRRAEVALKILQDRCKGVYEAYSQRKEEERRARRLW